MGLGTFTLLSQRMLIKVGQVEDVPQFLACKLKFGKGTKEIKDFSMEIWWCNIGWNSQ